MPLSPHRKKAQEPGPGPISSTSNTDPAGLGAGAQLAERVKSTWRRTLTTADGTAVTRGRCQRGPRTAGAGEHGPGGGEVDGTASLQALWAHTGRGNPHVLLHFPNFLRLCVTSMRNPIAFTEKAT